MPRAIAALGLARRRGSCRRSSAAPTRQALGAGGACRRWRRTSPDLVLIQDAARPFVDADVIDGVIAALGDHDGALPVVPVTDTIKRSPTAGPSRPPRTGSKLFAAQTPQGFRFAADPRRPPAGRANCATRSPTTPRSPNGPGIDRGADAGQRRTTSSSRCPRISRAPNGCWEARPWKPGSARGFDVHPFEPGDAVWLGGVRIPHTARLKGHSDADAALHALTDAIYGALGRRRHRHAFPALRPAVEGRGVVDLPRARRGPGRRSAAGGSSISTSPSSARRPKIGPHVAAMKAAIARHLRHRARRASPSRQPPASSWGSPGAVKD